MMLGAPLGSVSGEKRLDGGRDGLRALEESVVARAWNHDELTLWDRLGDRGRRRNRNGVIFAVDDKGWASDAAKLHGQCVLAEVGE